MRHRRPARDGGRAAPPRPRTPAVPVRPGPRRELPAYLTGRTFRPGAVHTEGEVDIAIAQYWDDCAALRRHLVDGGLLVRTADGSRYRRAA
ncbi:DUF2087 domain-containing protein [Streptomyces sp. NPDC092296]|uniref:DUF2087 domain-containing protein n=1 Tax=Streptomyces sp. NPDC092296 TaxID=3366012 RepID=UPI0037FD0FCB